MWFCRDFQICRTVPTLDLKQGWPLAFKLGLTLGPLCPQHSSELGLFAAALPGPVSRLGEAGPHSFRWLRGSEGEELAGKCHYFGGGREGAHN